jgi:hypothetical protein
MTFNMFSLPNSDRPQRQRSFKLLERPVDDLFVEILDRDLWRREPRVMIEKRIALVPNVLHHPEGGSEDPRRGWAEMIRKVYEVDPMACPKCGGQMEVIVFIPDFSVVDRIIRHLNLTFVADKPPPPRIAYQEPLMAAEASVEYFP